MMYIPPSLVLLNALISFAFLMEYIVWWLFF